MVLCTVTSNSCGGQPVSLKNLREICDKYDIPIFLDACWSENAYFIKRERTVKSDKSIKEIVRDMFDLADGATIRN